MKYADTHEFTSQFEPVISSSKKPNSVREKIKSSFRSLFVSRIDPTRLTRVERREMGVTERDIDWHNASHGPLIK
ncbi:MULTISPECIES: hypothetical protein [unclassified Ruegeria]|uniref:hypothetical protein n=1 Tax=unclassified Ruegeria TaxID=2625375 RepID=UPI0014929E1E|nr:MULTISPECIES: hypothetical protein [unclassified Ruegeria]NOD36632.1 hypothetical protein [Ruegeria sp. HKCCD7296]NOE43869.1 hypothetical protein [Ruegeria sp. HKCCD7319]